MKTLISFLLLSLFYTTIYAQNLISTNASFNNELNSWATNIAGKKTNPNKPTANFKIHSKGQDGSPSCKVSVMSNGKKPGKYKIFLKHNLEPLKKKKEYLLTFWVKSWSTNNKIGFSIFSSKGSNSKNGWGELLTKSIKYEGNGEWQEITHRFKAEYLQGKAKIDLNNPAIRFGFGQLTGTHYIDNISIIQVK